MCMCRSTSPLFKGYDSKYSATMAAMVTPFITLALCNTHILHRLTKILNRVVLYFVNDYGCSNYKVTLYLNKLGMPKMHL